MPRKDATVLQAPARRRRAGMRHTDFLEHTLVLAPLRFDANVKIEKHAHGKEALELLTGGGSNPFDHVTTLTDDDGHLRVAVHNDRTVQLEDALAVHGFFESVDQHGA